MNLCYHWRMKRAGRLRRLLLCVMGAILIAATGCAYLQAPRRTINGSPAAEATRALPTSALTSSALTSSGREQGSGVVTETAAPGGATQAPRSSMLAIAEVADNRGDYGGDQIPRYEKLEISFQILNTVAGNFQLPYDPAPPNGIDPADPVYNGISVEAWLTPDNWQTVYRQPAFYYQYFDDQIKPDADRREREWFYPRGDFAWKVRFSPHVTGDWQYRLTARDASGTSESPVYSFSVIPSGSKGFLRVSAADGRYFEFDDGTPFSGLGFNRGAFLNDPLLNNQEAYQSYQANGINLLRVWISGLYGSAWNPYVGGRNQYLGYVPRTGLLPFYDTAQDRTSLTMRIDYEPQGDTGWFDACRLDWWNDPQAVKQNSDYAIRVKYRGIGIAGPRAASSSDYGLVLKLGGWHPKCYEVGTSTPATSYGMDNTDWGVIEGRWSSGEANFLPRMHLALENVTQGVAYIDSVSIREELGNGEYGPEVLVKPSMAYDLYIAQEKSYAMDKLLQLTEQHGIYLKLVIHEKNDKIYYKIRDDGDYLHPGDEDNQDGFYGAGRTVNKTRWLQQAWWRYLQARWGYSPNVHSWELTNEGDPWNPNHYALVDELGKSMHCRVFGVEVGAGDGDKCEFDHPNAHLVSTSFWHSFPGEQLWANPKYPNVDYADVHAYVSTGWMDNPAYETDAALYHLDYSAETRSNIDWFSEQNNLATKPVVRGEAGIDFVDQQRENPDLAKDRYGVWLHNFLWSTLDPGAMLELYWWKDNLESQPGPDEAPGLQEVYRYYAEFIQGIPLNNGNYRDAQATTSDPNMRVTGQKDSANNRAHLWVQNRRHTWRSVVDGLAGITGLTGSVEVGGFSPNASLTVEWHEFSTQGVPTIRFSTATSDGAGKLLLELPSDARISDAGIKIGGP